MVQSSVIHSFIKFVVHLALDVPECVKDKQRKSYYASIGQAVNIKCRLNSRPSQNVTFFWTLNNQASDTFSVSSNDDNEELQEEKGHLFNTTQHQKELRKHGIWHGALQSLVTIVPKSDKDFGIVRCWAKNAVGYQTFPCLFHLRQMEFNRKSIADASNIYTDRIIQPSFNDNSLGLNSTNLDRDHTHVRPNNFLVEDLLLQNHSCMIAKSKSSISFNCTLQGEYEYQA